MLRATLIVLLACSGERAAPTRRAASSERVVVRTDAGASDAAIAVDAAAPALRTLEDALAALRARDLAAAADVIAKRVAQAERKMKLSPDAALATAGALLELADRASFRELAAVMPRSTVELARAVRERGVPADEADAIAHYLAHVAATLAFERLHVFDDNHSHVTGRRWHEIDYTGENMTWQGQRDYWAPRGVESFTRAAYIHAYFAGAEQLPHWRRVYRPRGRMADVTPPATLRAVPPSRIDR